MKIALVLAFLFLSPLLMAQTESGTSSGAATTKPNLTIKEVKANCKKLGKTGAELLKCIKDQKGEAPTEIEE